ncbi:MAG: hypothetical protein DHS80DRAFT_22927 [Piptocephalis tieghemiana]|nr:MAG: hypothetical protein DHS80DRAFT_22927 [Piptocephalis tieghemiana]
MPVSWSLSTRSLPSSGNKGNILTSLRLPPRILLPHRNLYSSLTTFPEKDPYKTLGLSPTSNHAQLKASFYQLTRIHHPDSPGGGDSVKFREVVDAWRFLSDPHRRRVYDERCRARSTVLSRQSGLGSFSPKRPGQQHSAYRSPTLSRRRTSAPDWMLHPDQGRKRPGKDKASPSPHPRRSSASFRSSSFRTFNHREHYWHHYGQDRDEHLRRMRAQARERMNASGHGDMGEHEQWASFLYRVGPVTGMVGFMAAIFSFLTGGTG